MSNSNSTSLYIFYSLYFRFLFVIHDVYADAFQRQEDVTIQTATAPHFLLFLFSLTSDFCVQLWFIGSAMFLYVHRAAAACHPIRYFKALWHTLLKALILCLSFKSIGSYLFLHPENGRSIRRAWDGLAISSFFAVRSPRDQRHTNCTISC